MGVIAFDFFFTEPYYSLRMTNPSEIWAAVLLFVIMLIVSLIQFRGLERRVHYG